MATLLAHLQGRAEEATTEAIPGIDLLTPEEGGELIMMMPFARRTKP